MERIFNIVGTIKRPGVDRVVEYLQSSNFATSRCRSHHTYAGGLIDHLLEVYNDMMANRGSLSTESIAICALFHDLGKSRKRGVHIVGNHPQRSVAILDMCGFTLTPEERKAIHEHHKVGMSYFCSPLRHALSRADMRSTGAWKEAHPKKGCNSLKNKLLTLLSKL